MILFLGQPRIFKEEHIVYGVVEEVLAQTVMLRISESLTQGVESVVFEADDAELKAAQLTQLHCQVAVGNVVKVLPIQLSLIDRLALLDVDIEGMLYLKFVEAHIEFAIEGIVYKIEANYAIVALSDDVFGNLEISELLADSSEASQVEQ